LGWSYDISYEEERKLGRREDGRKPYLSQSHRERQRKPFGYKRENTPLFLCDSSDPKGSGCETKTVRMKERTIEWIE
jgi:hypothetical protein